MDYLISEAVCHTPYARLVTTTPDLSIIAGIYVLVKNSDIVYIGHSQDVIKRMKKKHMVGRLKETRAFDTLLVHRVVQRIDRMRLEKRLILEYSPLRNWQKNRRKCRKTYIDLINELSPLELIHLDK